ncbi:hypothetical protein [Mycobacterium tilburgii]|uniref:hypothetical protein n=1 Tax=Mycobacterium tilburgii TaxID=44467 RepID=UPI00164282AD
MLLTKTARSVLRGEIVNSIAAAGILADHAATTGLVPARAVDDPWPDKPTAFARRKAAQ